MDDIIRLLPQWAKDKENENKKFFAKLRKKQPKNLDYLMQELHDATFQEIDCLACANCCKTTGPLFTDRDIQRLAKHFRMKEYDFIETYLHIDEDGDYVLQETPCAFLGADNYCSIYNVRPKACRDFPHTDRKKFQQIAKLTLENIKMCPAAFTIVEEMKKRIPH